MTSPSTKRLVLLPPEAAMALNEIIGIMTDQLMEGNMQTRWDAEALLVLQMRLYEAQDGEAVELDISDVALLLDGMAFTEVMSVEFPFFEMVQWTSDFVTQELRSYWSEEQWREYVGR
jgi:hypothetical protein